MHPNYCVGISTVIGMTFDEVASRAHLPGRESTSGVFCRGTGCSREKCDPGISRCALRNVPSYPKISLCIKENHMVFCTKC